MSSSNSQAGLPLVQVDGVAKSFRLYSRPSDRLKQMLFGSVRKFYREFKALKDISLTVYPGETVGIIGRNGAGKSTLLQIITGTLEPTQGTVTTRGRIAALLELGSGINPELTGRENIQLLAAILGLDSQEIKARTPAIIEFAALGEHIEQAVKTYSSGMYVRLAFAIATCVDPDVLIVDEALSVGDVAFRNKCMARISELRARNVSILFVSHDLSTLQMICDRAIWIEDGLVRDVGDPVRITQDFHAFMTGSTGDGSEEAVAAAAVPQHVTGLAEFTCFEIERPHAVPYRLGETLSFNFKLFHQTPVSGSVYGLSIYRRDGDWIIGQTSTDKGVVWPAKERGQISSGQIILKDLLLGPGEYIAALAAYNEDLTLCLAMTELNVTFQVRLPHATWGKIIHPIEWKVDGRPPDFLESTSREKVSL